MKLKLKLKTDSEEALKKYILEAKKRLGGRMVIPAHHYMKSEIVDIADFTGDSYKLALDVSRSDAEFIIFCGVSFMAEGAAILAKEGQHVIMPEKSAGCPMADMITGDTARQALNLINENSKSPAAPVVYMNSYIDSKSFCGEFDGSVCTSSNAAKVVKSYLDMNRPVFFFPDYHLGSNVAHSLGIDNDLIVRVNLDLTLEEGKNINDAKMYLWDGFCPIHAAFEVPDVHEMREKYPDAKIIVHPECSREVVAISDLSGSTSQIYEAVVKSSSGSVWVIGTELNFVKRIARDHPDKIIVPLRESLCTNMSRVTLLNTAMAIESVESFIAGKGKPENEIFVDSALKENAKLSLEKMISIVEQS